MLSKNSAMPLEARLFGEQQAVYKTDSLYLFWMLGGGILLLAAPIVVLALEVRLSGMAAVVALGPILGIGMIAAGVLHRPAWVILFDRGFVVCENRVAVGYSWEDVSHVDHTEVMDENGMTVEHKFTVHLWRGGQFLLAPKILGIEELGRTVSRQANRARLLALVRHALQLESAGKRVEAIAVFEKVAAGSPHNDLGAQARENLARLREADGPRPPARQQETVVRGAIDARLVGLWEQAGMLHETGAVVPWPEGSLNASAREFFHFGADGRFVFGRFHCGATVTFDEASGEFVTDGQWQEGRRGVWTLEGTTLIEFFDPGPDPVRSEVGLGEISPTRFVVNERPVPGFVLRVVYRRVQSSIDSYGPEPDVGRGDRPAELSRG